MPSFLGSRPNNYERCNPTKVRMNEDTWKGLWSSWPLISSIPLSLDKGTFSELPFCRTTFHEVYLWRPPEVHMSKSLVCRRNIFPGVKPVKRVGGMKSYNLESFIPAVQYVTDYTTLWRLKHVTRGVIVALSLSLEEKRAAFIVPYMSCCEPILTLSFLYPLTWPHFRAT